jgi:hypothetical protein
MNHRGIAVLRIVAAGAILASAALGQVVRTQTGQALDASPLIGSNRYNSPAPLSTQINSQLYVTGQVTGLARFHGNVGYFGADQLHMRLPSTQLGDFHRKSVGLNDVLSGTAHLVSPYQERTRTVLSVDDIFAGRATPGSNMPAASTSVSPAYSALGRKLYIDALVDYGSLAGALSGDTLAPSLPTGTVSMDRGRWTAPPINSDFAMPVAVPVAAGPMVPPATDLFAVAGRKDQLDLAQELYREHHRSRSLDAAVRARAAADANGTDPVGRAVGMGDPRTPGVREDRTPGGPIDASGKPTGVGRVAADYSPVNQDVFLDILLRLRQRREKAEADAHSAVGTRAIAPTPGADEQPLVIPKPGPGAREGLVTLSDQDAVVLRGLAGQSTDEFNVRMSKAGDELRARNFYDAAGLYETARLVNPRNPLARMGMGLSLLGAGESLSAAYQIKRAIGLFPPMMETQVDLSRMMDAKVIEDRLNLLDGRLKGLDSDSRRMLTFLATFLYYNSKQPDKAKTYAEKLRSSAPEDALLKAYAEYILSGKKPAVLDGSRRAPKLPTAPKPDPGGTTP